MSTVNERLALKKLYPNPSFAKKLDKMTDGQVLAIIFRLRRQGHKI